MCTLDELRVLGSDRHCRAATYSWSARRQFCRASAANASAVCAQETPSRLTHADEVVCVHKPLDFRAVGLWYEEFDQTSDAEVLALLRRSRDA